MRPELEELKEQMQNVHFENFICVLTIRIANALFFVE